MTSSALSLKVRHLLRLFPNGSTEVLVFRFLFVTRYTMSRASSASPTRTVTSDPDRSASTGGAPRTAEPKDPRAAAGQTVEKVDRGHNHLESPGGLDFDQDVQAALAENHAYVKERDARGNYLIGSTKSDPRNPRNWPTWKRYAIVILASTLNNLVCICVSGYSTGVEQMQEEFGFSAEVGTVGLSLYVVSLKLFYRADRSLVLR